MDDMRWAQKCSMFEKCSVNRCPLDPLIEERNTMNIDKFKKCKKNVEGRIEISKEAKKSGVQLKYDGMSGHEYPYYHNLESKGT